MTPIDFDANATTAPCDAAVDAMVLTLRNAWANPSSTHGPGQAARRVLTDARSQVARLVGCQPAQLVFTSGATEANQQALRGAIQRGAALGRTRLVLSAVEHAGHRAAAQRLADEGVPVSWIPVRADGRLDLAAAARLIGSDVALVSVMAANNETGVVMPVAELSALAQAAGAPLHVDATQALGKTMLRFVDSGADLWSVSAHKIGGPKGVGALVLRKGLEWPALLAGKQERNRRGGTENVPGIAGFGAAAEQVAATLAADIERLAALRDRLQAGLLQRLPDLKVIGGAATRLPNTLCLRIGTVDAEAVLQRMERAGVVASSGAACTAGGTEPSHVLQAMGLSDSEARAGVRLSLHRTTRTEDVDQAIDRIVTALGTLGVTSRDAVPMSREEPAALPA